MKSVLTSLRSRNLTGSIVLDGVIPHAAIELLTLLGVPRSEQKSLLARLLQANLRDVHRLFTLHKVFTLRIWTQVGVAFRSLPDNVALAPCDLCGVACRFRAKVLQSHAPGTGLCTPQLLPGDRQGSPLDQPRVTVAPQSRLSSRQPLCPSKALPLGKPTRLWGGPLSTNCGREVV